MGTRLEAQHKIISRRLDITGFVPVAREQRPATRAVVERREASL
jgi:hypothetical protein